MASHVRHKADERDPAVSAAHPDRGPIKAKTYFFSSMGVTVFLLLFFLFADRGFLDARRQKHQLQLLHVEISRLARETEALDEEVKRLMSDPAAAEKIAREELNLVRPGDVVLVLPRDWRTRPATVLAARSTNPKP